MAMVNIEFKARTAKREQLEEKLQSLNPLFKGIDNQCDTYFNVSAGRLKLREGNIENSLIWYNRSDTAGAKQSNILLYQHTPDQSLKEILAKANGVKVVVNKKRRIYFIENVKFHFDEVEGLGSFVEVEAIDRDGTIGIEKLKEQCVFYAAFFDIKEEDYLAISYSDMLLAAQ